MLCIWKWRPLWGCCYRIFNVSTAIFSLSSPLQQWMMWLVGTDSKKFFRNVGSLLVFKSCPFFPLTYQVCSDINKPNGQFILPNDRTAVMTFISSLPIRKVCLHLLIYFARRWPVFLQELLLTYDALSQTYTYRYGHRDIGIWKNWEYGHGRDMPRVYLFIFTEIYFFPTFS